jgi:carbamoyl-phosphate synthase large subunit
MCPKNLMEINILLTCVGGELAPLLIQNLKAYPKRKVKVIGIDSDEYALGRHFCDVFFKAPRGNSSGFKSFIEQLIIKEKINLIIPGSDEEAVTLSNYKDELENKETRIACVDAETINYFSDKNETYKLLKKNNIPCAKWTIIKKSEQLVTQFKRVHEEYGNFVVKPAVSRGGRDVFIINDQIASSQNIAEGKEIHLNYKDFIQKHIQKLKDKVPLVAMEMLFGPVHDIDMLGMSGVPLFIIPRKRITSSNPNAGHIIVKNEELIDIGKKIITKFKLSWLYDCDIMFDKNNKPKVIEINPRMSGSTAVCIEAGIPLLHTLIDIHTNATVENVAIPYGTGVIPYKALKKINN